MSNNIPKMKCLIIDDEPLARFHLKALADQIDFLSVEGTCATALEADSKVKESEIDLLFLDINMPYLSGLEFLEQLENPPLCILTTAYSEYALEGFRLQVADYLLKPIAFNRFYQAVNKAQQQFIISEKLKKNTPLDDPFLYVRQSDSFIKVSWVDILYVESMQNYTKLHFKDKSLIIHQTMKAIEESLPAEHFFRIHKSFLINITHIDMISGGRLFINKIELPISRTRKEELLNQVVYKKLISK
ncbi:MULTISPECIES: LytR/AlgR family response regulator transcription factor [Chryseobacterium]|jgi:Response regulator of the LytR/AlgR family|uniref:DNA-binding LytR/AlgR family response regulator n=1 Tax=Chryseobacterium rhizosphaerae TaxID=395937 RepID=A0AAE3YAR5_9FLAO|nr:MULTISPECIES: LytTR family DNA-binding domain-containing protein [Chryseobacterium]MBL3549781.1 response regulator transcription factor [Chryseobacterium sp. KMC2]MDC8102362.1 LytTR family DNA-binding domain-containing protein [Chryseobacterium rhizosphaerae]MDR6526721.1 DNA-binding LytR/AlgR family response regulator [Chryseobacterium rhizosphaerae]MDR6544696.1 DNA-binding LytR/AlgR family response regulator [Chryseobacterium rhizosphaerae]REC74099.1 DNA-binding response regulator [Chryseo